MILLDTNVISEAVKPLPSADVLLWLSEQGRDEIFTTAITQAEILSGIAALPPGQRRSKLEAAVDKIFAEEFHGHILPFDEDAAREFAAIVAARARAGRPISQFDAMIAAIARSRGGTIATRNTKDFEGTGVRTMDPWQG